MAEEEKILSIKVDYAEAIKGIAEYQSKIDELKKSENELKEQLKTGQIDRKQYNEAIAASKIQTQQYTEAMRVLNKEVNNSIRSDQGKSTSLKGLRSQLSNLTAKYDSLSREERNAAKGKELEAHINRITSEIKGAEEETQRFYRNVGNYMNSIKGAFGTAMQSASAFGAELKLLSANPFMLIVGVIASLINGIAEELKKSEEQTNRWRMALAPLNAIMDTVSNGLNKMAGWIMSVIEGAGKLWNMVMEWTDAESWLGKNMRETNAKMEERVRLEKMQQQYTKDTRAEVTKTAERERAIAELRAKVAEKDKYSAKERLAFLDEAIKIEKEQAARNKELAQQRLDMLQLEASFTDNDAAMNDKLEEAKAAVIKADTDLFNKERELSAQRVETINQINAEAKAYNDYADSVNKGLKKIEEVAKKSSGLSDEDFKKAYEQQEKVNFAKLASVKNTEELIKTINVESLKDKRKRVEEEIALEQMKYNAMSQITGGLIQLTEEIGETNKAAAVASKVLALAQIAIDTGAAISAAIKESATAPTGLFGFLATVGPYISTILTNMATAIKSVKSAKFATGGDVVGEGTATSDSIPAMLSNGESVMTARATSMFAPILSAFNQAGGGVPIYGQQSGNQAMGEDMLAKAFAKGIANMPSPVVSVEEISSVSNRVRVIENINVI